MDKEAKVLARLIDERGSRRAFAEEIGIPPTTLQSMLTRGVGNASVANVIKVCKGLGITVEKLIAMANDLPPEESDELTEEEILTMAAHSAGHEGKLTEEQLAKIKLAVKIALAKEE